MNAEKELLRPIEPHELEKKGNFKKYFFRIIGFLMILLILSYMLTGYSVMNIIVGVFDSEKVENNLIESDYGDIIFSSRVSEVLSNLYHENEKEFKACVLGEFNGDYILDKVFLPNVHFQDYDRVVSSPCPGGTLLDLHSHPQQHCTFSAQDLNGFSPMGENTLLTVMCGDGRFIFHKKEI